MNKRSLKYEALVKQKIGEFTADALKDREMSIKRLGKESGVSVTIIYKVLRGENYEITSLVRLFRHLQVHIELSLLSVDNNVLIMGENKPSDN